MIVTFSNFYLNRCHFIQCVFCELPTHGLKIHVSPPIPVSIELSFSSSLTNNSWSLTSHRSLLVSYSSPLIIHVLASILNPQPSHVLGYVQDLLSESFLFMDLLHIETTKFPKRNHDRLVHLSENRLGFHLQSTWVFITFFNPIYFFTLFHVGVD